MTTTGTPLYDHTYLPEVTIRIEELHPFLRPIFRVGGGDFRAVRLGGQEDPVILMAHNRLYPTALYLAYDNKTRHYSPALMRETHLEPIATLQSAAIWLPDLAKAYAQALRVDRPASRQPAA